MELIEITAKMIGPVAYNPAEGLSLDGPLAFAAALEREGAAFYDDRPSNEELAAITSTPDPEMPLEVYRDAGTWLYACSHAIPCGAQASEQLHRNKRFDDGFAAAYPEALDLSRKRVVRANSGPLKSYHMPLFLEIADRLVWHAIGEPEKVERLLRAHIHHLGKGHNAGHGRVASWTVESSDELERRWMWQDTQPRTPARPLPIGMTPDNWTGETAVTGYRPPYWLATNQTLCAMP